MNTKLFSIKEDDLATLETELPSLLERTSEHCNDPMVRKQWEQVKIILSNVRWNYGPPLAVEIIPCDSDLPSDEWKKE